MLYLNRRAGEAVILNNAIEVRVVEVRGKTVRLGLQLPARRVGAARGGVPADPRRQRGGGADRGQPARRPGRGMSRAGSVRRWSPWSWAASRTGPRCATPSTVLDELAVPQRGADRLGAPHARAALRLRQGRARRGLQGDRRRGRRGGAPAGHDRLADHPAGAGRAGREQGAGGLDSLYSIVQMPGGVPVGTLAIGRAGCDQRGPAGGLDPGPGRPGARRRARRLARSGRPRRWPRRRTDAGRREPRSRRARRSASWAAASSAA